MDPRLVLGVGPDATDDEIKKAYRALVKAWHPDTGDPGDVERFRAIREAYEALTGPGRSVRVAAPVSWTGGFEEPIRPFGEVRPRRRSGDAGAHLDVVMTPEEARRGATLLLDVPREVRCPDCGGRGVAFFGWCGTCGGDGLLRIRERIRFVLEPGVAHGDIVRARTADGATVVARVRISR